MSTMSLLEKWYTSVLGIFKDNDVMGNIKASSVTADSVVAPFTTQVTIADGSLIGRIAAVL